MKQNNKLLLGAAVGMVIGALIGFLLFISLSLFQNSASASWLVDLSGAVSKPLTELVIRLLCGPSPDIGCASGIGLLAFMFIWPLTVILMLALIGASIGLVTTAAHTLTRDALTRRQ